MASNNKINIVNPDLHDSQGTVLSSDINSGATSLPVSSSLGFKAIAVPADNYYIVIGNYGNEKTELCTVSAKTDTTFTVGATKYSHSASDPVTYIPYNKIKFYGRTVSGGANNLLATVDIDVSSQQTTYEYNGIDYSYFVASYYRSDSVAEESGASDEVSLASFTYYSAKKIIEAGIKKAMTKIDENPNGSLSWSNCIDLLNEGLNEIITKKKQWGFLYKTDSSISTAIGVEFVSKPTDVSIIDFIKIGNNKIAYATKTRFNQMKESGNLIQGNPYNWTLKNNKVYFHPVPSSVTPVTFEYYALPAVIDSLTQEVNKEFATMLIYFIASQAAYIRGNEKRGDKMYIYFNNTCSQQIEDITGFEQSGESESVEMTSIYGPYGNDEFGL